MKRYQKVLLIVLLVLVTALSTFLGTSLWMNHLYSASLSADPVKGKVEEIASLLEQYFVDDYDPEAMVTAAGDGAAAAMMEATGDRWSYYIPQTDMALHRELSENAYVGIGVTIRRVEQGEEIVEVIAGGPAEEAGVLVGDILLEVEGRRVAEITQDETRDLVRGEEGSFVSLVLLRGGEELPLEVERRSIVTPAAEWQMLDDAIAWIQIYNFDYHCAEHTLACVEEALSQGAEALLFDVRFNGGGYKDELVQILDALLPEGTIFHSVDYSGKEEIDTSDADCLEIPMAVLVNEESYSAAEYFAVALQEYGVAEVIGTKTSGKGNFQYVFDLTDGSAVGISCGKYYTPQGKSLTDVGLTPDVMVDLTDEAFEELLYGTLNPEKDGQLQAALRVLREKVS